MYAVDLLLSKNIVHLFPSSFYFLWVAFEITGHGVPWFIGCFYLMYAIPLMRQITMNCICALVFDLLVVGLIKIIFRRQRPNYNKGDMFLTVSVDKYSFPSGHTTRAVLMATFIINHIDITVNSSFATLLILWAMLIGISRIALGRHHISDVLFGALIGYLQFKFLVYLWLQVNVMQFVS